MLYRGWPTKAVKHITIYSQVQPTAGSVSVPLIRWRVRVCLLLIRSLVSTGRCTFDFVAQLARDDARSSVYIRVVINSRRRGKGSSPAHSNTFTMRYVWAGSMVSNYSNDFGMSRVSLSPFPQAVRPVSIAPRRRPRPDD